MPVQQTASTHVRSFYCSIVSKRCSTSKTCSVGDSNSLPYMAADSVPLDYLPSLLRGVVLHKYKKTVTFGKARFRVCAAKP